MTTDPAGPDRRVWYPSRGVSGMIDFIVPSEISRFELWAPSFGIFGIDIIDKVSDLIRDYGAGVYGLLFAIIFCETGLVIAPFLPGDSLLFALGIFCHSEGTHSLNFWLVFFLLSSAAFLGDNLNYQVGRIFGEKLFKNEKSRFFKKSYVEKTHAYFEKHGGKTLILARFVPIVRTYAPFVAGMGKMEFHRFLTFSAVGGVVWVGLCLTAGYLFGKIPVVQENFELAMLAVVIVSVVPMALKIMAARKHRPGVTEHAPEIVADPAPVSKKTDVE